MKVYIAGAITDNRNYKEQFAAAEERLRSAGHEVFNPARNQGYSYREYINMGLFELMQCDAIYLLKGYEKSTGATLEHDYARTVGLEVIEEKEADRAEELLDYLNIARELGASVELKAADVERVYRALVNSRAEK